MAAMFAGASRALLASVVFAFETTRQPVGLLPLLGGCTAAYLISALMMRNTIMTEKIARRGARVVVDYTVDYLDQVLVKDAASLQVVALRAEDTVESVRQWLESKAMGTGHQGWPVLTNQGDLVGVLTRRDIFHPAAPVEVPLRTILKRAPVIAYDDNSVREAADHMVSEEVGRLPVVTRDAPRKVVGWLTRSDMLKAHKRRLDAERRTGQAIEVKLIRLEKARAS
jgi:CBS domain-containing protein